MGCQAGEIPSGPVLLWYDAAMFSSEEQVLVVRSDWIHSLHQTRGFLSAIHPDVFRHLPEEAFFVDRPTAEADSSYRQVIPYVLVRYNGMYLTVTRHRTQGEERLHDKMSFGIGGHINPVDDAVGNFLDAGLRRELSEELDVDDPPGWDDLEPLGLICDDTDEVSQVHLGIVLRWDVHHPVRVRETDKMHGEYLTPAAIGAVHDRLENWSRLVYDGLISPSARPDAMVGATLEAYHTVGSKHLREEQKE
jgi:predicted NUDIX family phosphoesterase